jgi:hypothetical protein
MLLLIAEEFSITLKGPRLATINITYLNRQSIR